jgi:hypothetical protein
MRKYPQATVIRLDAFVVVLTWAVGGVTAIGLLLAAFVFPPVVPWVLKVLYGTLALGLAHVLLAFCHRCPICSKHPTIQGFGPVHPDAMGQSKLTGWSGVVMSVFRRKCFNCIHCGTAFDCE